MTAAPQRVWLTRDGRHVADGHPDAAFLAYAAGDDMPAGLSIEPVPSDDPAPMATKQPRRTK